jgi:hypothetical protein
MTPREQADALARELVSLGAFRWQAGMLVHSPSYGPMCNPGRLSRVEHREPDDIPFLGDPATDAIIAVQAMEAGAMIAYHNEVGLWEAVPAAGSMGSPVLGDLGIVAARALIAIKGGDRG